MTPAFDIIGAAFATADYTQSRILINPNDVESWLAYTSPGQSIKLVAYDHGELSDVQEVVISMNIRAPMTKRHGMQLNT